MGKAQAVSEPRFVISDLQELADNGVLMKANQKFFWPLGLALAWEIDKGSGPEGGTGARNLHVREWAFPDGHVETIELESEDSVADERRRRFSVWLAHRMAAMRP